MDKGIIDSVFKVMHTYMATEVQTEIGSTILRHSFELFYQEENGHPILTLCRNRVTKTKLNLSDVPFSQVCEWVQANINIFNN